MTERIRATVVFEFEASDVPSGAKGARKAVGRARRELPDPGPTDERPTARIHSVEKVTTTTEVVERTVIVTEEHGDEDDQ